VPARGKPVIGVGVIASTELCQLNVGVSALGWLDVCDSAPAACLCCCIIPRPPPRLLLLPLQIPLREGLLKMVDDFKR
jgi:hypothetical protein